MPRAPGHSGDSGDTVRISSECTDTGWNYDGFNAYWMVGEIAEDPFATRSEMLADVVGRGRFLRIGCGELNRLWKHTQTGKPLEDESFIDHAELLLG